jgi:hypothetical protein
MCKEIFRKIPIFMLESVGKFHCGYWNVLEMSTVPVDIHMLENFVSPVVWSCDIHHICWNFASVLVTVYCHGVGTGDADPTRAVVHCACACSAHFCKDQSLDNNVTLS